MKTIFLLALSLLSPLYAGDFQNISQFGDNPGNLTMKIYKPSSPQRKAPLLVLMHGCQQQAQAFATETGWQDLADRIGLYLVLPEQNTSNNGMRCFTWFEKDDVTRDSGEIGSIMNMIEYMESNFSIDSDRIYSAGLSAGATMSAALMATYPEKIAGGAIASGVSYGCAFSVGQSFSCMFAPGDVDAETRGDYVRDASGNFRGTYPKVTIFHGERDFLVKPTNADHSEEQWKNVHGESMVVEKVIVEGMGHGWPINSSKGCGSPSQFVVNSDICAAEVLARSWGLL